MTKLKGIIYTPVCKVKDNPTPGKTKGPSFLLESRDKEYVFSLADPTVPDADNYLLSWRNSLEYVIERGAAFREAEVVEGWLQKRGGKGHNYRNWKKRWFVLRGNLLSYYGDVRQKEDDISQLKGFIEVSLIIELDATSDPLDGYAHNFRILTSNGKEYILAARDQTEKDKWIETITKRIKKMAKLQHPITLDYKETALKLGKLTRTMKGKLPTSNFFVLSNLNLRYYRAEVSKDIVELDWAKGLVGTVPLIGCAVLADKDEATSMTLIDITGNRYLLTCSTVEDMKEWIELVTETSKQLVKAVIGRGDTIRLNCLARSESQNNGYTALNVDRSLIQLNFFMLKRKVDIQFKQLKRVYMTDEEIFCLRYETDEEIRVLNIICSNAKGVYEAISAAFSEVKGEGKGSTPKLERKMRKKKAKNQPANAAPQGN